MKRIIVSIAALLDGILAMGQNQNTKAIEEQKEMKDTVIVDGKLVEVGYRIITEGVTDGYTKIENGVFL